MEPLKQKAGLLVRRYWAIAFCFAVVLLLSGSMISREDDLIYAQAYARYGSLWGWVCFYAAEWSGRILPNVFLVELLRLPSIFFAVCNSIAVTLLLVGFFCAFSQRKELEKGWAVLLVLFGLLGVIPADVLDKSMYWKAAAVSYVWGFAAAGIAIYPIMKTWNGERCKKTAWVAALLCAVYCGNYEQSGVFALCFIFLVNLYLWLVRGVCRKADWAVFAVLAVSITVSLAMPGNRVRFQAETIGLMPNYGMYTGTDKLLWGCINTLDGIKNYAAGVLFLIALLAAARVWNHKKNLHMKICSVAVAGYYLLLAQGRRVGMVETLFEYIPVDSAFFAVAKHRVAFTVLALAVLLFLGFLLLLGGDAPDLPSALLLWGGFGTGAMMGFSPTIYATGIRQFYPVVLLLVFCLLRVLFMCIRNWHQSGRFG